eukprot:2614079-Rhodomonas_salina.1
MCIRDSFCYAATRRLGEARYWDRLWLTNLLADPPYGLHEGRVELVAAYASQYRTARSRAQQPTLFAVPHTT